MSALVSLMLSYCPHVSLLSSCCPYCILVAFPVSLLLSCPADSNLSFCLAKRSFFLNLCLAVVVWPIGNSCCVVWPIVKLLLCLASNLLAVLFSPILTSCSAWAIVQLLLSRCSLVSCKDMSRRSSETMELAQVTNSANSSLRLLRLVGIFFVCLELVG